MVTSASPRNRSDNTLPDVLPMLRPPLGPPSGKLTPRLPRSAGTPPPVTNTESGDVAALTPLPAPICPVAPLMGPGKSIASVLRSLPPSGLIGCCHTPEESASWPETRWRREKHQHSDEGLGSVIASPRHRFRAPCPPAAEPPANVARRPGRRANSEGVGPGRGMQPTARESANASLSARRPNRESIDKDVQRFPSPSPASGSQAHPPRPMRRTPRENSEHPEKVERRKPKDGDTVGNSSPRRTRGANSRPGYENSGASEGTLSGNSERGSATPRASSSQPPVAEHTSAEIRKEDRKAEGVEDIPFSQIEFRGSAKKQARDWFKQFLMETESEVQAAEAAKAAALENPAKVLIEEFDQERHAWEERTRRLLQSERDVEIELPCELPLESGSHDNGGLPQNPETGTAHTKGIEISAEGNCDESRDGQIAAALREAGLEPGLVVAGALAVVEETSTCKSTSSGLDLDIDNGCSGKAQWAMPAREWAAQRLRRKREKARQSVCSTPTTCTPSTPLLHSSSQVSVSPSQADCRQPLTTEA